MKTPTKVIIEYTHNGIKKYYKEHNQGTTLNIDEAYLFSIEKASEIQKYYPSLIKLIYI